MIMAHIAIHHCLLETVASLYFFIFIFRTQSFPKGTERVKIGLPHGTRLLWISVLLLFCFIPLIIVIAPRSEVLFYFIPFLLL